MFTNRLFQSLWSCVFLMIQSTNDSALKIHMDLFVRFLEERESRSRRKGEVAN